MCTITLTPAQVDDKLGFAKDRTISRLLEMQSVEYQLHHARQHEPSLVLALEVGVWCVRCVRHVCVSCLRVWEGGGTRIAGRPDGSVPGFRWCHDWRRGTFACTLRTA